MAIIPWKFFNYFNRSKGLLHFVEKGGSFDKTVLKLRDNIVLEGYFVSYKYFEKYRDIIIEDFSLKSPLSKESLAILNEIVDCNSISVHIRRGDYVNNEIVSDLFGQCTIEYYARAVEYIAKYISDPHFFVFSDDITWVKENVKFNHLVTYVTCNGASNGHQDLRLMSKCKHNIIANSTFSWWGAWLNDNDKKIVVAPTPAFDKLDIKDSDFYPSSWILLEK